MKLEINKEILLHRSTTTDPAQYRLEIKGIGNLMEVEHIISLITKQVSVEPEVGMQNGVKEEFIAKYCIKRKGIDYGTGEVKYIQFRDDMHIFDPDEVWEWIISRLSAQQVVASLDCGNRKDIQ